MKKNYSTLLLSALGVFILCVFTLVATDNLSSTKEENEDYYAIVGDLDARIESLEIKNSTLTITTSSAAEEYCAKTTKSTPGLNNICWKKLDNNKASTSVYSNKLYYVWIKDNTGKVMEPVTINSGEE